MTPVLTCLLIAGLLFPMISLLSGAGSLLHQWRHKSYASPVFIPFVGPLLLTIWVISAHKPLGLIALAWVCDIGTVAFLAAGPRLVKDWWHTSGLGGKTGGFFPWWAVAVLGLYFLPFIVIMIDERVLRTYWFSSHLPPWAGDAVRAIYPFHKLFS